MTAPAGSSRAAARIYHVGIVVENVAAATVQLSDVAGVTWGRVQQFPVDFGTPDGPRTLAPQFVMSLEGPPYIELLGRLDGTVWAKTGLHHLGMWTADVDGESRRIQADGCAWQAAIMSGDGKRSGGCYHLLPELAARVELVSESISRPLLEKYLAGGDYR